MAEIIVVHGYVGSGKSTQCNKLVNEGLEGQTVQHISAGNRLREIRTGTSYSEFSTIINSADAPSPLPDEVVDGVIFESIENKYDSKSLILIDGYPRHPSAVESFTVSIREKSHILLGTVALQTSLETSIKRILSRGKREGEKILDINLETHATKRYEKDKKTTNLAVAMLSNFAAVEIVNTDIDIDSAFHNFKLSIMNIIELNGMK